MCLGLERGGKVSGGYYKIQMLIVTCFLRASNELISCWYENLKKSFKVIVEPEKNEQNTDKI